MFSLLNLFVLYPNLSLLSIIFVLLHFNQSRSCSVSGISQRREVNRTSSRRERERERERERNETINSSKRVGQREREKKEKENRGHYANARGIEFLGKSLFRPALRVFPGVFHFFGNFRFFLRARELLDPSHRKPANSPLPPVFLTDECDVSH